MGVATCVTPSHAIYSSKLGRFLVDEELLGLQGMWRQDYPNQDAWGNMLNTGDLAQDLAGNGFTGTVAQAAFLTVLTFSEVWEHVATSQDLLAEQEASPNQLEDEPAQALVLAGSPLLPEPAEPEEIPAAQELALPVKRRVRGKTYDPFYSGPRKPGFRLLEARPKKRSKAECGRHGCGNKKAKGKKKMVTISEKEAIFQKYQELKEMGVSNPLQKLKEQKLPGYFHGCLFESKWGRVRREQQWELLVQTAPKLCQKHKELPNSLRRILNFSTMKHGEPATAASQKNHLPLVLQDVIENVLMDRIDLGEELGIPFVKNTILWCVELWNECLTSVKQMMKKQSLSMLQERDGEFAEMDHSQFECVFQQMVHKADTLLQPIQLSETDGALTLLDMFNKLLLFWDIFGFICACCTCVVRGRRLMMTSDSIYKLQ